MLAILLVLGMALMSATAFAAPAPKEKSVEVQLSITSEEEFVVIYVEEEIELVAITPKHGSSFEDGWVVLDEDDEEVDLEVEFETILTFVEGVNSYVSTATFVAEEAGTYTLKYNIEMAAGKSHVSFVGEEESDAIEVISSAYITGIVIQNYVVTYVNKNNSRAAGDIYFTFSEGPNQLALSFNNVVLNNGNSFTNTVSVEANDETFTATVTPTGWSVP